MKKLLLLLLLPFIGNAQLGLNPISPYVICETNTDGFAEFSLNAHISSILNAQDYDWEFYLNQADINSDITLPLFYTNTTPHQQTIYAVVTSITSGISQTMPFNLKVANAPNIVTPSKYVQCNESLPNDGTALFNLTFKNNEIKGICHDCIVSYYTTDSDVEINNPENFTNTSNPQLLHVLLTSPGPAGCSSWSTLTLEVLPLPNANPIEPFVIIDNDNDGITAIDLDFLVQSIIGNNPQNYTYGFYTTVADAMSGINTIIDPYNYITTTSQIYFRLESAPSEVTYPICYTISSINIIILPQDYETPVPTGNNQQTFTEGETLADIEIEGENILWYDNPGEAGGFTIRPKNNDTPLPLSTVLVNNTTYYASQTLNTIESTSRLAVTVTTTMGTDKNTFTTLKYYPNPVNDVLTVTNSSDIETLTVTNTLGQTVISKQINNNNAQLDLSSLNNGVYFVKVSVEGKNKTLKIIKQ